MVGREIYQALIGLGQGAITRSESLGHTEFVLTYKIARPAETGCHAA